MFNIGGGELMVILLVALLVLGPDKLPDAARKMGNVAAEFRKMSSGFQRELREAMDEPVEAAARERGQQLSTERPAPDDDAAAGPSVGPATPPGDGPTSDTPPA